MSGLTPEQIKRLGGAMHDSLEHCAHFDGIPGGGKQCSAYAHRLAPVVAALIAEAVEEARGEVATADPRVRVNSYVVTPTGYDDMVHSDKDAWCLTVTNGHAWGWSVRRGLGSGPVVMNRKGEWIVESRGSGRNKPRRWPLEEALSIALSHVDSIVLNGHTAQQASASVAARIARGEVSS